MGKISGRKVNDEKLKRYHLHRECVRRNPLYERQYKEMKKIRDKNHREMMQKCLLSDWGLWNTDDLPNPEKRLNLDRFKNLKSNKEIYLPGDLNQDPAIDASLRKSGISFKLFDCLAANSRDTLKGLLFLVYIPEESPEHPSITTINTRWSKKDIEESLLNSADYLVSNRKKHGLKQEYQKKRLRVEQGFEYLKVYDLRAKGKTFAEVSKKLWSSSAGDIEDLRRQACLYYKKAKELVEKPPIRQNLIEQLQERKRVNKIITSRGEQDE